MSFLWGPQYQHKSNHADGDECVNAFIGEASCLSDTSDHFWGRMTLLLYFRVLRVSFGYPVFTVLLISEMEGHDSKVWESKGMGTYRKQTAKTSFFEHYVCVLLQYLWDKALLGSPLLLSTF